MADTGFSARHGNERDNLLAPVASIGQAAAIAAGPWLFTVIALALIGVTTAPRLPIAAIEGFRLIVIYAFALSLVATAPIVIVATRLMGDAVYLHAFGRIKSLFVATMLFSGMASAGLAFCVHAAVFGLPVDLVVAGTSCCGLVGLIWPGMAFCAAVRDYTGITTSFLVGLSVAVLGAIWAALSTGGTAEMVWGFDAGLALVACGIASRVLTTFPHPLHNIATPIRILCLGLRRFWQLGLGGLLAAIAIWIDKWVVWAGPAGEVHAMGLVHAPLYDSAMFTACLVIIPALSLFVTHVETTFMGAYRHYFEAIRNHATLHQIDDNASALSQTMVRTLANIILVQAVLSAIAVLLAPSLIELTGLQYQQVGILRLGVLGALFQFVFLATSSLLLFFERHAHFLCLQALFLLLQAVLTWFTVMLGTKYYGFGNLVACVVCGLLALAILDRTMRKLTFIAFVLGSAHQPSALDLELSQWDRDESNMGMKETAKC